jgi:hypothetical protein
MTTSDTVALDETVGSTTFERHAPIRAQRPRRWRSE